MGTCEFCGTRFPLTRSTRKYCTPRCKTNACLERRPLRIRAADVEALHTVLGADFASVEAMRERLRAILAPELPPLPLDGEQPFIPRLD